MFYFKDAPIAPSAIDPDQIGRVQQFQASLGSEGALYWKFGALDEFERLLRLHLARQIQEFVGDRDLDRTVSVPSPILVGASGDGEEELGLLDFLDQVDEYFGSLNEITGRIGSETTSLGQRMGERTREMNDAAAASHGQVGRREARALIEKTAGDMDQFVARMKAEIPLFREALRKGADSAARAALLGAAMANDDRKQVREARGGLVSFRDALAGAHGSTDSFRASVQGLPRMTAMLNRAKRETAAVLQEVIESLEEGRRIVSETIKALDVLLGDERDA